MVDYIVTLVLGRMEGSNELVKTHNVCAGQMPSLVGLSFPLF
jgi:hypothetical protein